MIPSQLPIENYLQGILYAACGPDKGPCPINVFFGQWHSLDPCQLYEYPGFPTVTFSLCDRFYASNRQKFGSNAGQNHLFRKGQENSHFRWTKSKDAAHWQSLDVPPLPALSGAATIQAVPAQLPVPAFLCSRHCPWRQRLTATVSANV